MIHEISSGSISSGQHVETPLSSKHRSPQRRHASKLNERHLPCVHDRIDLEAVQVKDYTMYRHQPSHFESHILFSLSLASFSQGTCIDHFFKLSRRPPNGNHHHSMIHPYTRAIFIHHSTLACYTHVSIQWHTFFAWGHVQARLHFGVVWCEEWAVVSLECHISRTRLFGIWSAVTGSVLGE